MKRREAIFNFVILSAGALVLPGCGNNEVASIPLKNLSLTADEQALVKRIADLVIPKSNFIGAGDVNAAAFTLMMVDDCYSPEKQKAFKEGLQAFEKMAREHCGSTFTSCPEKEQRAYLTAIESKRDIPEPVSHFYSVTKGFTIQAFTSSKEYMTGVGKYKMVPGSNFKGCVPVNKT